MGIEIPPGAPGYRELVDFQERIGYAVHPRTREQVDTQWGVIHYGEEGCHIVPASPVTPASYTVEDALLRMQVCLVEEVTPELRAVALDLDHEQRLLYVRGYYDKSASAERIDSWSCAITEIMADLGPGWFIDALIGRLDYPQPIPPLGYCAYLRKEGVSQAMTKEMFPKPVLAGKTVEDACLAVQHALLGVVTPELQSISVHFGVEEDLLYMRLFYEGSVPKEVLNLWQEAMHNAHRDFCPTCALDAESIRLDEPEVPVMEGRCAYARKEPTRVTWVQKLRTLFRRR